MSPRPKVEVARSHLDKAEEEADGGDPRDAVQWAFASLEAAIDALSEPRNIAIGENHQNRRKAASRLHAEGVLPRDLGNLHHEMNELRKAVFYDGDEIESGAFSVTDAIEEVRTAVEAAERDVSGS